MNVKPFIVARSIIIFSCLLSLLNILTIVNREFIINTDYKSYLTGAEIITTEPAKLYDLDHQYLVQEKAFPSSYRFLPFKSSPLMAYMYSPLLYPSLKTSFVLFGIFNLILLLLLSLLVKKNISDKVSLGTIVLFVALFLPNYISVLNGQNSIFLYLIFVLIYAMLNKKETKYAGLASGLLIIKPQYLLAVPLIHLIARDRTNYLKGFLLSLTVLFIVSVVLSKGSYLHYPELILGTETAEYGSDPKAMMSLNALLSHFFETKIAHVINFLLYLVFLVYFFFVSGRNDLQLSFSVAVLLTLVFAVHVWDHDLVLLQLPLFILLGRFDTVRTILLVGLLMLPFLLLSIDAGYVFSVLMLASVILLFFFYKNKHFTGHHN